MQVLLIIVAIMLVTILASTNKLYKYCWFAYFLSFSVHKNLLYIYYYPNYIGRQNQGISVTVSEIIGLGLLISCVLLKRRRDSLQFGMLNRYILYMVFSFCGLIYSYNREMTINEIGIEIELMLVIVLVTMYFKSDLFCYFKYAVVVNSFLQAILCVYQWITGTSFRGGTLSHRYGVYRTEGLYITPAELAIVSLVSFFLLLALYLQNKKTRDRQILIIGMLCNVICILGGQSRTGFIVFAIGLLLIALIKNSKMRSDSKKMFRFTLVIGIIAAVIVLVIGEVDFGNSGNMVTSRVTMWLMGLRVFEQHPIIGIGNNAYTAFNSAYFASRLSWEATNPVHNIYILELAETGLIGFTLLFLGFYFPIVRLSYKNASVSIYYEALFIILFAQLIYCLTGWVFYSPSLRFYNMLTFAILMKMGEIDVYTTNMTERSMT